MSVARRDADDFEFFTGDFVRENLCVRVIGETEVNLAFAADDEELLVLRVVPVLSLCDAGMRDVDAYLSTLGGMQSLREASPVVAMHRQGIGELVLGKSGKVGGVEFLGESVSLIGNHQILRFIMKTFDKINYFAQCLGV